MISISRPYKAYNGYIVKQAYCESVARKKMGLDKGHPDFAQGETGRKQAANFKAAYDKAYNDCMKKEATTTTSASPNIFEQIRLFIIGIFGLIAGFFSAK
jgi:hypothetical protein